MRTWLTADPFVNTFVVVKAVAQWTQPCPNLSPFVIGAIGQESAIMLNYGRWLFKIAAATSAMAESTCMALQGSVQFRDPLPSFAIGFSQTDIRQFTDMEMWRIRRDLTIFPSMLGFQAAPMQSTGRVRAATKQICTR